MIGTSVTFESSSLCKWCAFGTVCSTDLKKKVCWKKGHQTQSPYIDSAQFMLIHWQCMDNRRAVYTKQHGKYTLIHTLYAHAKQHTVHTYWWLKCILMRQYWCTLCIAHCVQLQIAYLWLQLSGVTLKSAHAHCVCALCTHCMLLWCTTWASGSGTKYKSAHKRVQLHAAVVWQVHILWH